MEEQVLIHHGILGQKWGIRRYQNPDGTRTPLGEKHREKVDLRWARRHEYKIRKKAFNTSKKELSSYVKNELNYSGKVGKNYINAYNQKLAELMNKNVGEIRSPSGKVVRFVAKRREVGTYMALATENYDMNRVKRGVFNSGKIGYKKENVEMRNR